jgi:hypothetical protein
MGAQVPPEKMQAQFFPDSDHGINYNKAGVFQSRQLKMKLLEEKHRVSVSQVPEESVDLTLHVVDSDEDGIDFGVPNGMKEVSHGHRKQDYMS